MTHAQKWAAIAADPRFEEQLGRVISAVVDEVADRADDREKYLARVQIVLGRRGPVDLLVMADGMVEVTWSATGRHIVPMSCFVPDAAVVAVSTVDLNHGPPEADDGGATAAAAGP